MYSFIRCAETNYARMIDRDVTEQAIDSIEIAITAGNDLDQTQE